MPVDPHPTQPPTSANPDEGEGYSCPPPTDHDDDADVDIGPFTD